MHPCQLINIEVLYSAVDSVNLQKTIGVVRDAVNAPIIS